MLFILFVGVVFCGCEDPSTDFKEKIIEELSHLDKLKLAKEKRDNNHQHRDEDYEGWETFIDENEGIIISYPVEWKVQVEEDNRIVLSVMKEDSIEKKFQENFHLIISEVDDTVKADKVASDFYFEQQELYREIAEFRLIDEGFVGEEYDGSNWFLEYEIEREEDSNMYSVNMFFHRNKKIYLMCFYTIMERKEALDPTFDKIIRSFAW